MRRGMIAVAALLISPLLIAQDKPSGAPRASNQADEFLYHQVVRDDGLSLGLVTDPQGVDFRPYLTGIFSALKTSANKTWLDGAGSAGSRRAVIELEILRDGSLYRLALISPSRSENSGPRTLSKSQMDAVSAAGAALSSASPFPPLSKDFKGDRIIAQLIFAVN